MYKLPSRYKMYHMHCPLLCDLSNAIWNDASILPIVKCLWRRTEYSSVRLHFCNSWIKEFVPLSIFFAYWTVLVIGNHTSFVFVCPIDVLCVERLHPGLNVGTSLHVGLLMTKVAGPTSCMKDTCEVWHWQVAELQIALIKKYGSTS